VALELDPQRLDIESIVLAPLAGLYWIGWNIYEAAYAVGLKSPFEPKIPVIVVGNLTVGGMGKTPTVVHVATVLRDLGYKVVIGASGYGGPRSQAASVAPDGLLRAGDWGDEPALLRLLLPDVPLIVGRRRVLAAELAATHFPDHVMLMDDGYQHKPLMKHISIILDPGSVRNPLCLPAGPYREPRSHRHRADFLLPDDFEAVSEGITLAGPDGVPVNLPPQDIQVLCAIARPYRFVEPLTSAGFKLRAARFLRDHDPMTAGNLLAPFDPKLPLLVTAKDWVKLRDRQDIAGWKVYVANYSIKIEPAEAFQSALRKKLNEVQTSKKD